MLPAGTRLGPYEIVAPIGAGGMGEVYRAHDTNLKRAVAIKVLPAVVAGDADRLARFQREAEVLAALNHPNIAAIYGLEKTTDVTALVMELVEGEDLAAVINRGYPEAESGSSRLRDTDARQAPESHQPSAPGVGPRRHQGSRAPRGLSTDDVVAIARQIAEAIEAAHDAGVIHRDLKPANVKLRADGTVKVLDFGLAKIAEATEGAGGTERRTAENSPTLTARATQMGMIIGTAAYMAPEQAKGKPVDKRADVWAFGCVVYELITGRRTFSGDDVSETLASVLRQDVDWTKLPATTPARLRRLLERCLERDPRQRLRDIGEARVELSKIEAGAPDSGTIAMASAASGPAASGGRGMSWIRVGLLTLAVGVIAGYAGYVARPSPELPVVRFKIVPPDNTPFGPAMAVSPDGRHLAFLANNKGVSQVWIRAFDTPDARPLPGTESADISLFWSPDSRSVGFFADGKVKRMLISGGAVQPIADAPAFSGATWNRDDVIVFSPDATSPLFSVKATGGTPSPLTATNAASGEQSHRWPSFLPDGRHFLYYARHPGSSPEGVIYVSSLDEPAKRTEVLKASAHAVYAPSAGLLLFLSDRTLMAQSFDLASFALSGEPVAVADDVGAPSYGRVALGQYSASDTGVLVHGPGQLPSRQFAWVDRHGKELARVGEEGLLQEMRPSPDHTRLAFRRQLNNNSDVWILDLARGVPSRFTFDPRTEQFPVWSPDSARVVFSSNRSGNGDLYIRPSNGSSPDELLFTTPQLEVPTDWSPDGKSLLYFTAPPSDILVFPLIGDPKPRAFITGPAHERDARFSPDGAWIAYVTNESSRDEVFVQSFAGKGGKAQISAAGGTSPVWRTDGRELFYLAPDRKLMAVPIANGAAVGLPVALFQTQVDSVQLFGRYAASADGQRFLVNSPAGAVEVTPLTVVQNWMPKKGGGRP